VERTASIVLGVVLFVIRPLGNTAAPPLHPSADPQSYLGFDRNDYPGDANLKALRQTFSYAGFWLNNPPGEKTNTWAGKRDVVESAGFGFLVLFNGRLYAELKTVANASKLGQSDAQAAVAAAKREGFPAATIIFLDQEQGGRMLPEQKAYVYGWVDGITAAGFRAGVYCSGMPARLRQDARFPSGLRLPPAAAPRSPMYGSSPSPPRGRMWRQDAVATILMEAAIRRESI
jgi:Domain of unknown function (DUF1906)